MQTKVFKIDPKNPDKKIIGLAAEKIRQGAIVAFPTETVYGLACRVDGEALERLDIAKDRPLDKRYTLVIPSAGQPEKYVPNPSVRAKKLISSSWPGPLTIIFKLSAADLELQKKRLGPFIYDLLYTDSTLGVRCPLGKIPQQLLEAADCPVVAPSANISGQPPAEDARQVIEQLDGRIDMILDAGQCAYKTPSTIVKFDDNGNLDIVRPGAISKEKIITDSTIQILFVCTGNTCRSPMAEGICKKFLSEKMGSPIDQLPDFGYKILSAGVMAATGMPVSSEAVEACESLGIDISNYTSSSLTDELLLESDYIFVMTQSHLDSLNQFFSVDDEKLFKLKPDGTDISDPIGADSSVYRKCAKVIYEAIKKRIGEIIK